MKVKLTNLVFFIVFIFLISHLRVITQDIPDCMCVPFSYPPNGELMNSDSAIVIDTCGIWYPSADCDSAYWNNIRSKYGEEAIKKVYSKGYWDIKFEVPAIPIPATNADTIIYIDWTAIDTAYSEIRNGFQQMEENFGDLYFRKLVPNQDESATRFFLFFTDYVNVDSILVACHQIPNIVGTDFGRWPAISQTDVHDIFTDEDYDFQIYPNPSKGDVHLKLLSKDGILDIIDKDYIKIFNIFGEEIQNTFNKNRLSFDFSNVNSGIYYICIYGKCQKITIIK